MPKLIRVEPTELVFNVEGGRLDETRVKVYNIAKQRIGYKFFTDNDAFVILPKSGFVDKGGHIEATIKLSRVPPNDETVHVIVVKGRAARNDELDRDKEWRTATVEDETKFHVINLKCRFLTAQNVGSETITALQRLDKKLDDNYELLANLIRINILVSLAAIFAVVLMGSLA